MAINRHWKGVAISDKAVVPRSNRYTLLEKILQASNSVTTSKTFGSVIYIYMYVYVCASVFI